MAKLKFTVSTAVCLLGICLRGTSATEQPANFDESCTDLKLTYESSNVVPLFSELVPAGADFVVPDLDPSCTNSTEIPVDFCRLGLNVTTSERSDLLMEVWLPRDWSGRFLSTGNGGINGCIDYEDMAYAASLGFATTGSNNGHSGQNGTRFLNNLEVVKDYSYRALTTSSTVGKEVTDQFYDEPHKKAYYLGCSTGGRMGFKMAQDFPEIFDGIVAGAPAVNFQGLMSWSGTFHTIMKRAGPDGVPPRSTWSAIDAELLAQCDHLDGASDGIIEDPSLCNFELEPLICGPGEDKDPDPSCITGKQADTVRQFLAPVDGLNGRFIYPRMEPATGFLEFIVNSYEAEQFLYTDHWFKYALYNDPDFNTTYLGPEEWEYAFENDAANARTWSGDLSGVSSRGAKILHYHGMEDVLISPASSMTYYDLVSETMGMSTEELDEFYRFFRVSGMAHCRGGNGASGIGNKLENSASSDPVENVLMAMVKWVEDGVAPDAIVGNRFVDDEKDQGVEYKRSHCKYPLSNTLDVGGDPKNPEDWSCT